MIQIPGTHVALHSPVYMLLLLCIPLWLWIRGRKQLSREATFHLSTTKTLAGLPDAPRVRSRKWLHYLRIMALVFFCIALSRPQQTNAPDSRYNEGIDIVLSMDLSTSMLAEDFKPNRIEAAKDVAEHFVMDRPADRIGLVVFAGESFTQAPITTDHNVIIEQLENLQSGMLADGTAIGMGLATAVDRLRSSTSKSKVVILLTDGVNNSGYIDPQTALRIAQTYKVRVYTIGVGSKGSAMYPVQDASGRIHTQPMPVQIDEALLTEIAQQTGGKYFRATDNASLKKIYNEIDQLEKSKIAGSGNMQYKEWYWPFALLGVCLLALELLLSFTVFRSIT